MKAFADRTDPVDVIGQAETRLSLDVLPPVFSDQGLLCPGISRSFRQVIPADELISLRLMRGDD